MGGCSAVEVHRFLPSLAEHRPLFSGLFWVSVSVDKPPQIQFTSIMISYREEIPG
jgi:hypothetical protein